MMVFGIWLLTGVVIGMILMAFLAIGTYTRGYDAGYHLRKPWRAELDARHAATRTAYDRAPRPVRQPQVALTAVAELPARITA